MNFNSRQRDSTGFLVLQNAQPVFCTKTLDRRIHWAKLDEILHGTLKGHNSSNYREIFRYSVQGPSYRVPLGPQGGGAKILKIFFPFFFIFCPWRIFRQGLWDSSCLQSVCCSFVVSTMKYLLKFYSDFFEILSVDFLWPSQLWVKTAL